MANVDIEVRTTASQAKIVKVTSQSMSQESVRLMDPIHLMTGPISAAFRKCKDRTLDFSLTLVIGSMPILDDFELCIS